MCFILSNNSVASTKNLYQKISFEFDCTEIFKKKKLFLIDSFLVNKINLCI